MPPKHLPPIVGIGAGGHAVSVIDAITASGCFRPVGLLDADPSLVETLVAGVPVLGADALLTDLQKQGMRHAFIGLGTTRSCTPRRRIWTSLTSVGWRVPSIAHPTAVVSPLAQIGDGLTALARAAIGPEAVLGVNVLINTGAIVEHHCHIGSHTHIASGAVLAGGVCVGEETLIGAGAVIRPAVTLGSGVLVGAGAVVVADVPNGTVVVGNPAKPISTATPQAA